MFVWAIWPIANAEKNITDNKPNGFRTTTSNGVYAIRVRMETLGWETEILKEVSRKKVKKDGSWGKGITVISNEANLRSGYAAKLERASYTRQTYIQIWFILLITKKEKVTDLTFPAFAKSGSN